MADNTRGGSQDGADPLIATDEVTYSGDTADVQLTRPVHVTGAEGSKTVVDVTSADGLIVNGNVAHDAADAGNPIKIGGAATDSFPTQVTAGDRVNAWFDTHGRMGVFSHEPSGLTDAVDNAAVHHPHGLTGTAGPAGSAGYVFNGTTWDRQRGDTEGTHTVGNEAHDAADAGNPVKIGGKASVGGVLPAAVADGDRVNALFDEYGRQHTAGEFFLTNGSVTAEIHATTTGLYVGGDIAHDIADSGANPLKVGGRANAAAPADVSANNDRVDAWFLRNGAQATVVTAAGALIGGDAANGLDVDVTRLPALPAGTANIGDVDVLTVPAPLSTAGNGTAATAHRVTIASDSTGVVGLAAGSNNIGDVDVASIAAGDNNIGNVDIVTMPALPAGTNNIGDVDVLTLPGVGGLAAHASATSGNPVYIAGRASAAIPTDVGADGDAAGMWTNRNGATVVLMAPHVGLNSDPWALVHEGAQYTSAQTSTVLVAGGASEKIVVTKLQIQAFGTTAFDLQVYFGTGAFARGTNRACFDGTFKPSSTLAPGAILDGPFISGANGDDLLVTTSAAGSVTISVWYYVVV
jgi:hypothetical protein